MKNKTPKKIKVGAVDYTVHLQDVKDREQLGCCLYAHQRIYLTPNMLHQNASDTLLHEVLHAIWNESGLSFVPDLEEETIVRTMATWLRIVISNNPKFLQFIVDASDMWPYGPTHDPDKEAEFLLKPLVKEDDDEDDD
jgi:hypothetical protein